MYSKYIIFKHGHVLVFNKELTHDAVALSMSMMGHEVASAGLVMIDVWQHDDGSPRQFASCIGESFSLKVGPAPGDSELVTRALGLA